MPLNISFSCVFLKNLAVREGYKLISLSFVKFILELDPVKTKSVQEALHNIHTHKYRNSE